MGIQSLNSFIEKNSSILTEEHRLQRTKLVIDGLNLGHYLYIFARTSSDGQYNGQRYGGNYTQLADTYRRFFTTLKKCEVEPLLVFDGLEDHSSKGKSEFRFNQRLERLDNIMRYGCDPESDTSCYLMFNLEVLLNVLKELEIRYVRSFGEADEEAALIANKLKCPVLSNDSDYYMFDIKCGYICAKNLCYTDNMERDVTMYSDGSYYLSCRLYNRSVFTKVFPGLSIEVLPLFSVMMGNSYRPRQYGRGNEDPFMRVIKKWVKPDSRSPWTLESFSHKSMFACLSWLSNKSLDTAVRDLLKLSGNFNRLEILKLVKLTQESMQLVATTNCLLKHLNKETCDEEHGPVRCLTQDTDMGKSAIRLTTVNNYIVLKPVAEILTVPSTYLRFEKVFQYIGAINMEGHPTWLDEEFNKEDIESTGIIKNNAHGTGMGTVGRTIEYGRAGRKIAWYTKESQFSDGSEIPAYGELLALSNEEKRTFIGKVFGMVEFDSLADELIEKFSLTDEQAQELGLCVNLLKYTFNVSRSALPPVSVDFVKAMILSLIYYLAPNDQLTHELQSYTKRRREFDEKSFEANIVHNYSAYQYCLWFYTICNDLLEKPMIDIKPGNYLNGILVYNVNKLVREDSVQYASGMVTFLFKYATEVKKR